MMDKVDVTKQQMLEYITHLESEMYNKDTVEDKLDNIPFKKIER